MHLVKSCFKHITSVLLIYESFYQFKIHKFQTRLNSLIEKKISVEYLSLIGCIRKDVGLFVERDCNYKIFNKLLGDRKYGIIYVNFFGNFYISLKVDPKKTYFILSENLPENDQIATAISRCTKYFTKITIVPFLNNNVYKSFLEIKELVMDNIDSSGNISIFGNTLTSNQRHRKSTRDSTWILKSLRDGFAEKYEDVQRVIYSHLRWNRRNPNVLSCVDGFNYDGIIYKIDRLNHCHLIYFEIEEIGTTVETVYFRRNDILESVRSAFNKSMRTRNKEEFGTKMIDSILNILVEEGVLKYKIDLMEFPDIVPLIAPFDFFSKSQTIKFARVSILNGGFDLRRVEGSELMDLFNMEVVRRLCRDGGVYIVTGVK